MLAILNIPAPHYLCFGLHSILCTDPFYSLVMHDFSQAGQSTREYVVQGSAQPTSTDSSGIALAVYSTSTPSELAKEAPPPQSQEAKSVWNKWRCAVQIGTQKRLENAWQTTAGDLACVRYVWGQG